MSFAVAGLGTALPPNSIDQAEAAEVARLVCCRTEDQATVLTALYRHTGIARRHMIFGDGVIHDVKNGTADSGSAFLPSGREDDRGPTTRQRMQAYREEALPLALRAAGQAMADAGTPPAAVTHLVTVSCTGFAAPGVDVGLMKGLGLAPTVQRTHVGFMGCHGAINGLRVARAFTTAEPGAHVLVCCVELSSLHYHYGWHPRKVLANALFADGAAAVVGVGGGHAKGAWRLEALGSCVFPESEFAMGWNVGDHGFEMTLSPRIPGLIAAHLGPWLTGWLRGHGLSLGDVGTWAVHPGGPRILSAVEEALGLGTDALAISREVLAECGNMSSPTVLFIIDRLRHRQAPRPCVALGFGPGLVAEVALFS